MPKVKKVKGPRGRPKMSGPDVVCCVTGERGAVYHHIYTRKAFPKLKEVSWNKMPLNVECHYLVHQHGMNSFAINFPMAQLWLVANGWYMCPVKKTWQHQLPENMDRAYYEVVPLKSFEEETD